MIARLNGTLIEKAPPFVIVDCQGVGYEVEVPMSTFYNLPELGQKVQLLTHFVVREDAQLLYGFGSEQEKNTFKQLLKVNGIGAKSALSILSGVSIGKKTAERLLLELKDKFTVTGSVTAQSQTKSATYDVLNALVALGYNEREANAAVKLLDKEVTVAEGIKQALKSLAK
jgi:holliday junction DNA helicase RuvA